MDTLDGAEFDVLIAGTGIQQSLLALALSRSGKKVLHIDKNNYYGGAEAAFSLQEVESWVKSLQDEPHAHSTFGNASITQTSSINESSPHLGFSRAYSLALAPQLIYTDSTLLPSLVSSKTYRQLEFVAMGSWFVYDGDEDSETVGTLLKIPTTREDLVFSDKSIDIRSKRAVMKVLRFLVEYESQDEVWHSYAQKPFSDFLSERFKLPDRLHGLFSALTLSLDQPQHTSTAFALPRVARHLRSTGQLGPGFSSVIPKWGGLCEIAQVGCRAGAVGGAVYVLDKSLKSVIDSDRKADTEHSFDLKLTGDEHVKAAWLAGTMEDIETTSASDPNTAAEIISRRSISIISYAFPSLFPALAEGGPPPAGAVVVFPAGSLFEESSPVYLVLHSSDTGECPEGQCVVYGTTRGPFDLLDLALNQLMDLTTDDARPLVLWCLRYEQLLPSPTPPVGSAITGPHTIVFPPSSSDLAFDEAVLEQVKDAWLKIIGTETDDHTFLVFEDRNPVVDEDGE